MQSKVPKKAVVKYIFAKCSKLILFMITFFTCLFLFVTVQNFSLQMRFFLKKYQNLCGIIIFTISDDQRFMMSLCFYKQQSEKKSQNTWHLHKE